VAGTCKCGNEPSGSIKCEEFLDYLRSSELLEKDSAPWSDLVIQSVTKKGCYFHLIQMTDKFSHH
jgi:hypothetical protein